MRRKRFIQLWVRSTTQPPGFETSFLFDGLGLFPPAADMGREAKRLQGLTHLIKVVALIQAQTLGALGSGRWAVYRQAVHRNPHQLHIVAVGPVHRHP